MRAGIEAALAAWAADPVLAAPLADSARAHLVLDGAATTIRHASPAAAALAAAVADADGTLAPWIAGQIRAAGGGKPRLVRLRLDPRRIAPPTACLIADGALDAAPALLLVVAGPLPAFRPRLPPAAPRGTVEPAAGPEPEPVAAGPAAPAAGDRFVWRSDADDRLTTLSGPRSETLAPVLVGQSWAGLARDGRLTGADTFLSALDARRTFRAAPAALALDAAGTLALELSGACLGRGGEAFSGFGGYGVVREVTVPRPADVPLPMEPPSAAAATGPHPAEDAAPVSAVVEGSSPEPEAGGFEADPSLPDTRTASWPPATVTAARFGVASTGAEISAKVPGSVPPGPGSEEPSAASLSLASEPAAVVPPGHAIEARDAPDDALSVTEHAAFREIARALGARYAGDDERDDPAHEAGAARGEGGAVMPFPVAKPVEVDAPPPPEPADAAPLDDLPAALLIHRGDAVLAANRRLLDLAGYADLASLQSAGLGRLFRGLPPDFDGADVAQGADRPLLIETASGGSRPVAVEHGPTLWHGAPAACLILRAVAEADPAAAEAAERLARIFREGHATDARAALDALEDGVVTLDPAARIVAMNPAAAGLLGCDPREVVGTGFDALFEPSQRDAVGASVEGLGTETRTVAGNGRPLALRVTGRGGTRVATLRAATEDATRPPSGFDSLAFLGRLDREIRTPVEGIVGRAENILAEPHGPIDERDRATLRAIKTTAGHVRGLVADLIDLATIESGGRALAVRPLPLNDLVSGCVELLQPEAARGRIVLRTSFSPDLAPLEADEPSMRQATLTVIGNAIRATSAGGQVIVSTTPGECGGAALKVRGTGPGMSPAEIEDALEPLGAGAAPGTGLGLPLTKALVEANQGRLRISSRGNEGTLVEILLPGPQSRSA